MADASDHPKFVTAESRLLEIPPEVLEEILVQLNCAKDITACGQTCKHVHALIADSTPIQYILTLSAHGLHDTSFTFSSAFDRLAQLRARRAAWRSAVISGRRRSTSVRLPGQSLAYDFVGGCFAHCVAPDGYAQGDENEIGSHRLALATLLSSGKSSSASLETHDIDVPVMALTLDPSQDLLVLLEVPAADGFMRIHLRRLTAPEQAHPNGALAVMQSHTPSLTTDCILEIADHVVAIWGRQREPYIFLFNWRTGTQLVHMDLQARAGRILTPTGFAFVSPRVFMLVYPSTGVGVVNLYSIPDGSSPTLPGSPTPVARLLLPPLARHVRLLSLKVTTGPWLAHAPTGSSHVPRNERRIHAFTLVIVDSGGAERELVIVVRARAFLDAVSAASNSIPQDASGEKVHAERTWGHRQWLDSQFRVIELVQIYPSQFVFGKWHRHVHGARLLIRTREGMCLLDFDAPMYAQEEYGTPDGPQPLSGEGPTFTTFKSASTPTYTHGVFAPDSDLGASTGSSAGSELFVSSLPYSCVCFPIPSPPPPSVSYKNYMLDEGRIMALRTIFNDGGPSVHLDVWSF